jgi:ArsR family transcriptional regulator
MTVAVAAPREASIVLGTGDDIDVIQASLLRAMASPQRLRIIHLLGVAPREVNELARELGAGQAAMSQHLAAMRAVGLVEATREGRTALYRLCDPEILEACGLMREVLVRRLARLGNLAATAARSESTSTHEPMGGHR